MDRDKVAIPNVRDVLLISRSGVTVININIGIVGVGKGRQSDPGDQGPAGGNVFLDLVIKYGHRSRGSKDIIVAVGLSSAAKVCVRISGDQNGEISLIGILRYRATDRNEFAIQPFPVVPGRGCCPRATASGGKNPARA